MNNPKVSIVTICKNAGNTIQNAVQSVLSQDYPNIEYIIVDGKSSDDTLEKINSFDRSRFKLLSEKDDGLYDALNKGINLSGGDIIGILHADDKFAHSKVISNLVEHFKQDPELEALSASVKIFKKSTPDKLYRIYRSTRFRNWQFRLGIQPPHPGFFISRNGFDKVGYYRTQYKICGDFEFLLRAVYITKLKVKYSDEITTLMLDGGMSSSGWKSKVQMNDEILKILKLHGIYSNKFLIYSKYLFKLFQLRNIP